MIFNPQQRTQITESLASVVRHQHAICEIAGIKQDADIGEDLWVGMYARAWNAPRQAKSNLPFRDFDHDGRCVELKRLRRRGKVTSEVGKSLMLPSVTRAITIDATMTAPDALDAFCRDWNALIPSNAFWGISLQYPTQYAYFEQTIEVASPDAYEAEWATTVSTRGKTMKENRSLYVSRKDNGQKVFSLLPNGNKVQKYFTVPTLAEMNVFDLPAPESMVTIKSE